MTTSAYPGPACEAVGLTKSTLLAATGSHPRRLPKLACVTNELVIELEKFRVASNVPCDVLKAWVANLSPETSSAQPTTSSFMYCVKKVVRHRQQLQKTNKALILPEFLRQIFQLPSRSPSGYNAEPSESDVLKKKIDVLIAERDAWKEKAKCESHKLHNVRRREKRKCAQLAKKKTEILVLKSKQKNIRQHEVRRLNDKVAYYRKLNKQRVRAVNQDRSSADSTELKEQLANLKQENFELQSMNAQLREDIDDLHTFLCRASVDASAFMVGEDAPFLSQSTSTEATSDVVKVLLEPNPSIDGLVQQLLQAVFQTLSLLVQRVVGKYLAGGEWNEAGDEVREVTKSVSKTNTISERDFGKLDRYIREKPNAGLLALEAHILFTTNKTASWLDEKSDKEKEIMFMKARKLAPQHQKAFRERQKAIEQDRQEALAKKQLALEQRQLRILKEKEKYTREMTEYGLWQTTEEIKAQILRMSTKKRQITALKAQLRFRKHVLQQQHADSSIYQFSDKASGNYSVQRLQENLSRLVLAAQQSSECSLDQVQVQDFLTHKRVSHCFSEEGKDVHYTGTVVSQVPGFSLSKNSSTLLHFHFCILSTLSK